LAKELGDTRLTATTDPSMAAALTRRETPQVVFIDACAPEHAAWRALTSLQPDGVFDGMRVFLFAQDRESSNAIEIGEFAILTKPLFVEKASDRIHDLLRTPDDLVLIADEDLHARQILAEALSAVGCKVTVAADGNEATKVLLTRKPSMAIISLTLRGLDGIIMLSHLRSDPATSDIDIVMTVPRELTTEQMDSLQHSISQLTSKGELVPMPLTDMIRGALDVQAIVN
jgi:CheY-like chemotaxis protein